MTDLAALFAGWKTSLGILAAALVFGWLLRTALFRHLHRLSRRTATRTDDVLLDSTRRYWLPAILFAALLPAVRVSPLEADYRIVIERAALTGLLLMLTFATSRFVGAWLAGEPVAEGAPARPSLLQNFARTAILLAGAMLVLDNAGVEIKTLLTALGVGSLAVALALQPTLSNLFAGLHLSVSKPIRVGDQIELEDGTRGMVADIGWRTTQILQPAGNLAIVPNARLSDMRLLNYSLPAAVQAIPVPVGVAYDSDLEEVERITLEVAATVQRECETGDPDHQPSLVFTAFADSAITFNVVLRARAFTDRLVLVHEFLKRLHARYAEAGIEIPYPQQVVHLRRGGDELPRG